jgi:hypothetical protein
MRYLLLVFSFLAIFSDINGQGAGFPTIGLEVEAGANFAVVRSPILDEVEAGKLSLRPGYQMGLNLALWPSGPSSLIFTTALMQERGVINDYRLKEGEQVGLFVPPTANLQTISGEVTIKETWFRVGLEGHFRLKKFVFIGGVQVSTAFSGSLEYDFTKTTIGLYEPITDQVINFEEPIVRDGSREFYGSNAPPGHVGAILGLGFEPTERLSLRLRYDLGLRAGPVTMEFRMRRARLGVTASYLFWYNER